jgi:hypothetical protein
MDGRATHVPATYSCGDPEYVNVVPTDQWTTRYVFLADPTYRDTNLVFTRARGSDGAFHDVELDCVGTLAEWSPVGSDGKFEYVRVDLTRDGGPQGACDNGVHSADSTAPFSIMVWGWDACASYAYPAGLSMQSINDVVPPVL